MNEIQHDTQSSSPPSFSKNTWAQPAFSAAEHKTVRRIAIGISVLFLLGMIILPMIAIFTEAFAKGITLFIETLTSEVTLTALWFSIIVTSISVIFAVIFGICAAWCIAYFQFPGRKLLVSVIDLPVSISPIIIGLMFMIIYGKYGFLGKHLEATGITIIFAFPGLILTNISITLPYVARSLIPAMQELGKQQEEVAHLLGARGWQILFRVTLPRVKWALLYGIILATARGAGEFGAASVVSGFIRKKTVTLPLQINIFYNEYLSTQAFVSATLFVLLSVITLIAKQVVEKRSMEIIRR